MELARSAGEPMASAAPPPTTYDLPPTLSGPCLLPTAFSLLPTAFCLLSFWPPSPKPGRQRWSRATRTLTVSEPLLTSFGPDKYSRSLALEKAG